MQLRNFLCHTHNAHAHIGLQMTSKSTYPVDIQFTFIQEKRNKKKNHIKDAEATKQPGQPHRFTLLISFFISSLGSKVRWMVLGFSKTFNLSYWRTSESLNEILIKCPVIHQGTQTESFEP